MSDPAFALIVEERMLPEQWRLPTFEHSPEQRLLAAVLRDAFDRLRLPSAREARAWFDNPDHGAISLRWVCDHLGLDPSYIKRGAGLVFERRLRIPRRQHYSNGNGRGRIALNERIREAGS